MSDNLSFRYEVLADGLAVLREVADGGNYTNMYVAGRKGAAMLVDTGRPGAGPDVIRTLQANGWSAADFRYIVITHEHWDHYGATADLRAWANGAKVLSHIYCGWMLSQRWTRFIVPDFAYGEPGAENLLQFEASQRQACRVTQRPRSTQRYHPQVKQDEPALIRRRHELVRRHPRFGYRRIWAMLRAEGRRVNRKRVRRLWKLEGFRVPQKTHKKRLWGHSDNGILRHRAWHKEDVWTWDFLHDSDEAGRLRDELLNLEVFANLAEAKALAAPWQQEYNHVR